VELLLDKHVPHPFAAQASKRSLRRSRDRAWPLFCV
jgi:hypothetical protein